MMKTANELRTMVINNSLTLGRLSKDTLGDDYKELTTLYRSALDSLTEWASKDYKHTSTVAESDAAFEAIKAILNLFATDENRIIIDQTSMRTMRDLATKPRRDYSAEYKKARTALNSATKTLKERTADLITLGAPERLEDESLEDYSNRVKAAGINTLVHSVDMFEMYVAASKYYDLKAAKEQEVKDAGNWTWKRPMAVSLTEFADLVENYIADCLVDGYNLKSSKTVRDEKAAERAAKKEAAKNA